MNFGEHWGGMIVYSLSMFAASVVVSIVIILHLHSWSAAPGASAEHSSLKTLSQLTPTDAGIAADAPKTSGEQFRFPTQIQESLDKNDPTLMRVMQGRECQLLSRPYGAPVCLEARVVKFWQEIPKNCTVPRSAWLGTPLHSTVTFTCSCGARVFLQPFAELWVFKGKMFIFVQETNQDHVRHRQILGRHDFQDVGKPIEADCPEIYRQNKTP